VFPCTYTGKPPVYHQYSRRKPAGKLQENTAGLMARTSVIASQVYRSFPGNRRKYPLYKAFTGFAMELLKEKWAETDVKAFLLKAMVLKPNEMVYR
jgi:hypothetical protein